MTSRWGHHQKVPDLSEIRDFRFIAEGYAERVKPLIVFLAGVGQETESWDQQVRGLEDHPSLVLTAGHLAGERFTLESAAVHDVVEG